MTLAHAGGGSIPRRACSSAWRSSALFGALALASLAGPATATAAVAPGIGQRLVGPQAQGPATKAVSALHHNPAMLTALPGVQITTAGYGGIDVLGVERFDTDARGRPVGPAGGRVTLINPALGYFVGASYQLEPVAVAAGFYELSSRRRPWSSDSLRYHLARDPDVGCALDPRQACPEAPRNGGMHEVRTDFSLAVAWSLADRIQLGIGLHVPRLRVQLSHDNDTRLLPADEGGWACDVSTAEVADPRCAERLSFAGRSRLRWFGLTRNEGTRFDFATTFGLAVPLGKHGRVGFRYRTRPWLNGGQLDIVGRARVCRSDVAVENDPSGLPTCTLSRTVEAKMSQPLPRELALGLAWDLGPAQRWHIDGQVFWQDTCPGGTTPADCNHADARHLSLVGLDREAAVLPELELYRGRQDIYGSQIFAGYDLWKRLGARKPREFVPPRVSISLGAGVQSPGTRPSATTAAESDGWTLSADVGPRIELVRRHGSWILLPGYGIDVLLPQRVGPGGVGPAFDPEAALDFAAAGSDIHAPAADAVLHGRARPTNAGVYSGSAHVFSFALRWSERG